MLNLLVGTDGCRKYLTNEERSAVLSQAAQGDSKIYTFCLVLATTGCRISEALNLSVRNIDYGSQSIVIECLKKRRQGVFRSVPVPEKVLQILHSVHGRPDVDPVQPLWPWSRMTAWRRVNELMGHANVRGSQASPKGFRHGFGVSAIQSGVPLNMVQKWLGHADMRTTAIYTCAVGPEELALAERMWGVNLRQAPPRAIRPQRAAFIPMPTWSGDELTAP